jgi:hypothetical protein
MNRESIKKELNEQIELLRKSRKLKSPTTEWIMLQESLQLEFEIFETDILGLTEEEVLEILNHISMDAIENWYVMVDGKRKHNSDYFCQVMGAATLHVCIENGYVTRVSSNGRFHHETRRDPNIFIELRKKERAEKSALKTI